MDKKNIYWSCWWLRGPNLRQELELEGYDEKPGETGYC